MREIGARQSLAATEPRPALRARYASSIDTQFSD
jgi:hypothetical protein